jgi:hypothetical protein
LLATAPAEAGCHPPGWAPLSDRAAAPGRADHFPDPLRLRTDTLPPSDRFGQEPEGYGVYACRFPSLEAGLPRVPEAGGEQASGAPLRPELSRP